MTKTKFLFVQVAIVCFPLITFLYSAETTLLLTTNLSGGGYTFQKEPTAFGGKLNLSMVPAMKWNNKVTCIPFYSLEYSGVKDVKELVGGGTLVQQYITNTFYIKPIFKMSKKFKLKPKLGVTSQLLKEVENEPWGKGLFDYYKTNIALDIENKITESSVLNISPGIFSVSFYNYKTLATQKYGKELSSVGTDILNFLGGEIGIDYKQKFGGTVLQVGVYELNKMFADQFTITDTGEYSTTKRNDNIIQLNLAGSIPLIPVGPVTMYSSLGCDVVVNDSNQNHYDVERTKYIADYYDYTDINLKPQISFGFNTVPMNVSLSYTLANRQYSGRLTQDSTGNYKTDKTNTLSNYTSLVLSFPIMEKLTVFVQQNYISISSNMKYEQVYSYNYTAYNIFAGVSYEY